MNATKIGHYTELRPFQGGPVLVSMLDCGKLANLAGFGFILGYGPWILKSIAQTS